MSQTPLPSLGLQQLKEAWGCLRLQLRPAHLRLFLLLLITPLFSFQWPPAPIADSSPEADLSVRLPSLAIIAHAPLILMSFSRSIPGSPRASRRSRPSASLGRAPDSAAPHCTASLLFSTNHCVAFSYRAAHNIARWHGFLTSFLTLPSFYLRLQMLA